MATATELAQNNSPCFRSLHLQWRQQPVVQWVERTGESVREVLHKVAHLDRPDVEALVGGPAGQEPAVWGERHGVHRIENGGGLR